MESKMTQLTEQEARQMIAVVNTRNVDKVVEQYSDDASFQVPSLDSPLRGKEAIRSYLTSSFAAFPDWTMDVSKVIVSGDEAIVVNSVHGTHTGSFTSKDGKLITPTNKKFVQEQLTRVVVNEKGKVSMFRAYGNPTEINRLLGWTPQTVTTHTESTSTTVNRPVAPATVTA
jgi:ketosteroid isomerase-like protein